jgi:hypothetical protein
MWFWELNVSVTGDSRKMAKEFVYLTVMIDEVVKRCPENVKRKPLVAGKSRNHAQSRGMIGNLRLT